MNATEFSKTRVFIYMSKLWEEHASLNGLKETIEDSVNKLQSRIRNLQKRWWSYLTVGAVRDSLKRMKKELGLLRKKLLTVKERCEAITKTTGSWTTVFEG
ncbi:hypothetical protein [Teredinibacter purpureus]|uniref:hypothetical protein n=1 Tax=Teredinibacter purpureus TaxID=2731756 RepID=UPI0005F78ABB|nr:hypothetical protein [Teredinibacter purpureus]